LMGACLARSGAPVTMVVRAAALAEYPQQVQLESPFGKFTVPIAASAEVPACDVLWLTVKATQLEESLAVVKNPDAVRAIVPLLNGIDHLAFLRSRYGNERVIPATIAVESERVAPGHIVHRSSFARLNVASTGRALLASTLDALQKLGFESRFIDHEPTLMWSKLVFLGPFALTTTASNKGTGEILSDPQLRDLGMACIREACAVAVAEGAQLKAEAVIAGLAKMPGNMRSSMQKDVEQGRTPELDAIAGPILRGAEHHHINIPATRNLVAAVEKRVNAQRR
jgi:2-dehydropantoate 2-reductase